MARYDTVDSRTGHAPLHPSLAQSCPIRRSHALTRCAVLAQEFGPGGSISRTEARLSESPPRDFRRGWGRENDVDAVMSVYTGKEDSRGSRDVDRVALMQDLQVERGQGLRYSMEGEARGLGDSQEERLSPRAGPAGGEHDQAGGADGAGGQSYAACTAEDNPPENTRPKEEQDSSAFGSVSPPPGHLYESNGSDLIVASPRWVSPAEVTSTATHQADPRVKQHSITDLIRECRRRGLPDTRILACGTRQVYTCVCNIDCSTGLCRYVYIYIYIYV